MTFMYHCRDIQTNGAPFNAVYTTYYSYYNIRKEMDVQIPSLVCRKRGRTIIFSNRSHVFICSSNDGRVQL